MAMFGSRQVVAESRPVSLTILPPPTATLDELEAAEYEKVCSELGMNMVASTEQKIARYLHAHNISTYELASVHAYLHAKPEGVNTNVAWAPLREGSAPLIEWSFEMRRFYLHESISYRKPVPLPALYLVRDMESAVGKDMLAFFVSDYARNYPRPDPFLAVAPRSNITGLTVIFKWDEPAFK